jgi:MFS family permease
VRWTFAIDAATYAASIFVIWLLPRLPPLQEVERPSLAAIVDGFRFLKGRQALIGIFAIDTNAMVFGMPSALFPAIALHRLHGDAATVGYLYAAPYAGALACSLVSGWCSHVRRMGLGITLMACLWGGAIAGFGLQTALWPALVLLAVAGGADFFSAVLRSTMLLRATPDHLRGRLLGIEFMQVASAPSLGDLEAGVLASVTSLRFSVVSGGVACIAGCVVTALALPQFLRYESRPAS